MIFTNISCPLHIFIIVTHLGLWVRNMFTRATSSPRNLANSAFKVISDIGKLEEENWNWYRRGYSTLFV